MPSTKDINLSGRTQYLFIGPNGRGKSIAAASIHKILPAGAKIYFFDFDGRMPPIKAYYPEADIEYDTYGASNFKAFSDKLNYVMRNPEYSAIILDSVTSLSISCINYQLSVKGQAGEAKGKTIAKGLIQVTTWDDINGETILFSQILDALKTYPGTVIVTAHPVRKTEIIGDKSLKSETLVSYGPKVASILPNYFNEIYSFEKELNIDPNGSNDFIVRTNDTWGKTAFPLPPSIKWTGADFFPLLHGYLERGGISI